MNVKRLLIPTFISALALAGAAPGTQQATTSSSSQGSFAPTPLYGQTAAYTLSQNEAAQLAQKYIKAETEEDRRELRRKLQDVLAREFDDHAKRQEQELEALRKEIDRLESLMRKRRDAKSGIIERRMEQLVQEAQGLGWNAPGSSRSPMFLGGGFGTMPSGIAQPALPVPPAHSAPKPPTTRP